MATAIDLTGSPQEIDAILAFAKKQSTVADVSEPTNLDASRALNVGLPNVSPTEVLTFLTVVFTTGKAALEFLKALREQIKAKGGVIAVSESTSGKPLGRIEAGTSDATLTHLVPQ
jgi:glycerate-2-kinase